MNSSMREVYSCYFNKDVSQLKTINLPDDVKSLLELSFEGKLVEAIQFWQTRDRPQHSGELAEFIEAHVTLTLVKIGRRPERELLTKVYSKNEINIIARYAEFSFLFWVDQEAARKSLWKLLRPSVLAPKSITFVTTFFLLGHLATIAKASFAARLLATFVFHLTVMLAKTRFRIPPFSESIIVSAFPFTLFVAGRLKDLDDASRLSTKLVPHDPYYQTISMVSFLYSYSYSGDVVRTEIYCNRFKKLHERGQLLRYRPISNIIALLPLALRGHSALIRSQFEEQLAKHNELDHDASINSQFYRVCALISLSLRQFKLTEQLLEKCTHFRKEARFNSWTRIDERTARAAREQTVVSNIFRDVLGIKSKTTTGDGLGQILLATLSEFADVLEDQTKFEISLSKALASYFPDDNVRIAEDLPPNWNEIAVVPLKNRFILITPKNSERISFCQAMVESILPAVKTLEHMQSRLSAARDMERKHAKANAIVQTTSMLAHDVRKPFSMFRAIIDTVESLESPEEAKHFLKEALPEVRQAMASVNGMLADITEVGGDTKLNLESVCSKDLILNALTEAFKLYPQSAVELHYDLSLERPLQIDRHKVARVFSNIIGNALQAMNFKGKIEIRTAEVSNQQKNEAQVTISNSGSQIDKALIPKIFDAFFTFGKKSGTGLGLAIAHKIVTAHGGRIWCESDSNGVRFHFTLPVGNSVVSTHTLRLPSTSREVLANSRALFLTLNSDMQSTHEELSRLESKARTLLTAREQRLRMVVVDDEGVYRNSIRAMITKCTSLCEKTDLKFAQSFEDALRHINSNETSLVFVDLDLGANSANGFELIDALRKRSFDGFVCVLSNRTSPTDIRLALDSGANAVLPKPIAQTHFLNIVIQSLTNQERHL